MKFDKSTAFMIRSDTEAMKKLSHPSLVDGSKHYKHVVNCTCDCVIWSITSNVLQCQSWHSVAMHLHKILLSFWQLFQIFLKLFCWLLIELTPITSKNYEVVKHEIWQVCSFYLNWSGQTQKSWKSCQMWNKNLHACDNSPMCCCTHIILV